jgi:hypothetical protein
MFWRTRRPHVDAEDEAWLIECWRWLTDLLGPVDGEPPRQLLLPSRQFFPVPKATGHARAHHYFDLVQGYMGLADRGYQLAAQPERPNLGSSVAFGAMESKGAAGTYSVPGNTARITYDPGILNDPMKTVAVFAHELAHDILLRQPTEPPGGSDLEEFATDLATVHLGFGLFGANVAFEFSQFTDFDRQGWSYSRSGYLGESEWSFALALFLALQGREPKETDGFLKQHLSSMVRRAHKYLVANPDVIAHLRQPQA